MVRINAHKRACGKVSGSTACQKASLFGIAFLSCCFLLSFFLLIWIAAHPASVPAVRIRARIRQKGTPPWPVREITQTMTIHKALPVTRPRARVSAQWIFSHSFLVRSCILFRPPISHPFSHLPRQIKTAIHTPDITAGTSI